MADPLTGEGPPEPTEAVFFGKQLRKEKRKALKKLKRKQIRKEAAIREKEEEEARLNDPEKQLRFRLREQEEEANSERERRQFEERERLWLEAAAARKSHEEEDERRRKLLEVEERKEQKERACGLDDDDEYEYVEEGPAEIIWQGNEIIVKKKRVKVEKRSAEEVPDKEDDDRPTSNPLPPQSAAFSSYVQSQSVNAQEVLDNVTQQITNFGTEQDKAHCPFHLKTGACRFGSRCSRVHFYPEESCTLLIKNMYNGLGLSCEEDEGLEYTDEEIHLCYEEFYEDVHTEFLKFGEIVNFKVCKNSSYHLRGNVYVHYKSLESAIHAYNIMSARYYAGKQIICEFVGVTRWKVAICGEYMKSRLKTCSHGSACNFIHSFRNPGGDYEWADWDNPPPKYWIKKMAALFGLSGESGYENELESEDYRKHKDSKRTTKSRSYRCGRHNSGMYHYDEMEMSNSSSDGERLNSRNHQYKRHSITRKHSSRRQNSVSSDENEQLAENQRSKEHFCSKSFLTHSDEVGKGISKEENGAKKHGRYVADIPEDHRIKDRRRAGEDRPSSRRKRNVYSEEQENPECNDVSKSHKKHIKKQLSSDRRKKCGRYVEDNPEDHRIQDRRRASEDCPSSRRKRNVYSGEQENSGCNDMSKSHNRTLDSAHCRGSSHNQSNVESFSRQSIESQDQCRYSLGDVDSDKDFGEADSLSGKRRKYEKLSSQHQRSQQSHEHRYNADEFRKGKSGNEKLSSYGSPGRWKLSDGDSLLEESY